MHSRHWNLLVVCASFLFLTGFQDAEQPTEATYVGWETCADCHDVVSDGFERTVHGRLADFELRDEGSGCEGCHGPGSLHADTGEPEHIRSFANLSAEESAGACLACHASGTTMEWAGSAHDMGDVACADCHAAHEARSVLAEALPREAMVRYAQRLNTHAGAPPATGMVGASSTETCFECHGELRAKFAYASHHPVSEGFMTCASCHLEDGAIHGNTPVIDATRELCTSCHGAQEGPHIFEHSPVEEDCTICHDPHGAVANNLLAQNEPFLCLQCHEQHFHGARVGATSPVYIKSGGSDNPNGTLGFMGAFNTRCTSCHPAIHGSDLPSLSITGKGGALVR